MFDLFDLHSFRLKGLHMPGRDRDGDKGDGKGKATTGRAGRAGRAGRVEEVVEVVEVEVFKIGISGTSKLSYGTTPMMSDDSYDLRSASDSWDARTREAKAMASEETGMTLGFEHCFNVPVGFSSCNPPRD